MPAAKVARKRRRLNLTDRLIVGADTALKVLSNSGDGAARAYPAETVIEREMSAVERRHAGALMRVNHAGEVAAQGLYQGQALTARNTDVQQTLATAAQEELDHLAWTRRRLRELNARPSLLGPVWYGGAFVMGSLSGLRGDRFNLGFLAETERQVVAHLDEHLRALPPGDGRSRAVLETMRRDEDGHADSADHLGGAALPKPVRGLMGLVSKVMTRGAYWL